jgi:hypothetical protein
MMICILPALQLLPCSSGCRIAVYDDFIVQFNTSAARKNVLQLPPYKRNITAKLQYGHAAVIVGYNNTDFTWTILNSCEGSNCLHCCMQLHLKIQRQRRCCQLQMLTHNAFYRSASLPVCQVHMGILNPGVVLPQKSIQSNRVLL